MQERKLITIAEFQGSYNIGAYGLATDKYAIVGEGFRDKTIKEMQEVLSVPVVSQNVMDEPIVGIMLVGNSFGLLVPELIRDDEIQKIKEVLGDINIEKVNFKTYENALGNIILTNDRGAVIHSDIFNANRSLLNKIEDALNVEIAHYNFFTHVIRTAVVANNKGAIVHPLLSDEEIEIIKEVLKLEKIGKGTGNMGSPYVGTCYIVNSNGIVAGLKTTGPELQRAYELLL